MYIYIDVNIYMHACIYIYLYMYIYIYLPSALRWDWSLNWVQNREVRKVHNKRNVGGVYVHERAFVETPKTYKLGKTGCNGLSFLLRTSSMSKSVKLVTVCL